MTTNPERIVVRTRNGDKVHVTHKGMCKTKCGARHTGTSYGVDSPELRAKLRNTCDHCFAGR